LTRSDLQRIADIRDEAGEIEAVVALGRSHFLVTRIHQRGVERLLEIIGEATSQLSPALKNRYPTVNWKDIAGLRVRLAHRYHRVDPEQVWVIAAQFVPELVVVLDAE
jgi:uncharacterized protein with HEPN domain